MPLRQTRLADADTTRRRSALSASSRTSWAAFSRTEAGKIYQRAFGGMTRNYGEAPIQRTCAAADRTGHAMLHAMYGQSLSKNVEFFGSQEQAAAVLRQRIGSDDTAPEDSRHVYKIGHAGSPRELGRMMDESMSRYEWQRIAKIQYRVATGAS